MAVDEKGTVPHGLQLAKKTTVNSFGGGSCLPVTQRTKVSPDVQLLGAPSE